MYYADMARAGDSQRISTAIVNTLAAVAAGPGSGLAGINAHVTLCRWGVLVAEQFKVDNLRLTTGGGAVSLGGELQQIIHLVQQT